MEHYDHIFIVTNDLTNERRVKRIINAITDHHRSVLLIGRELNGSVPLGDSVFDQHRIQCWFNGGPLFYLEFYLRTTWLIIRNFNADHITCNDLDTILIGRTLKRLRDFKLYLDCHEWFEEVSELEDKALKKGIWKWVARRCTPVTDARYTVNSMIAKEMGQAYQCEFEVVKNISPPIDKINWKLKEQQDLFRLVYLGVLNKGRGLEQLIASMEQLDQVELDIIGDGDITDQLREQLANSPVSDRIKMHGSLKPEQFIPILQRSHVGINLLLSTSKSYYYSSANKLHDYLNHGLLVLTMQYPYYRMLAKTCSSIKLIDSLEPNDITSNIQTIIEEYDSIIVNNARTIYLDQYSWHEESIKITQIYGV